MHKSLLLPRIAMIASAIAGTFIPRNRHEARRSTVPAQPIPREPMRIPCWIERRPNSTETRARLIRAASVRRGIAVAMGHPISVEIHSAELARLQA